MSTDTLAGDCHWRGYEDAIEMLAQQLRRWANDLTAEPVQVEVPT